MENPVRSAFFAVVTLAVEFKRYHEKKTKINVKWNPCYKAAFGAVAVTVDVVSNYREPGYRFHAKNLLSIHIWSEINICSVIAIRT